jgi:hypothetical protein
MSTDPISVKTGPQRPPRLFASLLTLAFALSQIVGFLHLALVQHAPCLEHGGMMHVEDGGHTHTAQEQADPLTRLATGEIEDHNHEDCVFGLRDRDAVAPDAAPEVSPPRLLAATRPAATPYAADFAHAPLWLVAPKRGPPALV